MIKKRQILDFEKHHAFIIIFMVIAFIFIANVFIFNIVHSKVVFQNRVLGAPVLLSKSDIPEEVLKENPISNLSTLEPELQSFINQQNTTFAVAVIDLTDYSYVGVNDTTTIKAASMYKLFVAYEVLLRVDEDSISLNQPVGYDAGEKTVDECLQIMINASDNDCGRALRKLIGAEVEPLPRLAKLGFVGTSLIHDYPTTSAKDVALLFDKLYRQSDLSQASNTLLLKYLLEQTITNRIPAGVPKNVDVANKTGDLEGYSHDGGIVYAPSGDYVLVVLSGSWPNGYDDAPPEIVKLSELVYDWFKSNS